MLKFDRRPESHRRTNTRSFQSVFFFPRRSPRAPSSSRKMGSEDVAREKRGYTPYSMRPVTSLSRVFPIHPTVWRDRLTKRFLASPWCTNYTDRIIARRSIEKLMVARKLADLSDWSLPIVYRSPCESSRKLLFTVFFCSYKKLVSKILDVFSHQIRFWFYIETWFSGTFIKRSCLRIMY